MEKRGVLKRVSSLRFFRLVSRTPAVGVALALGLGAVQSHAADQLVVGDGTGSPLGHVKAIAEAKGFSEPGLDITWMRFASGVAIVEGIAAGKLQVGIAGDTPAMALVAGGAPAKIIAKHTDSSAAYALYSRQDANIQRPEDLYGKTVGFTFGSQAQALWISILDAHKLDGSKIKTVNLFPSGCRRLTSRVRSMPTCYGSRAHSSFRGCGQRSGCKTP